MLTLKRVRPEQASPYYTPDNERSQTEIQKKSFWYGDGALRLGLENSVSKKIFKQLLEGYLPDGSLYKKRGPTHSDYKSIAAIDLCFNLPKSASLLIGIKGSRPLLNTLITAAKETLDRVEIAAAKTRIRTASGREIIQTDNLVIANFLHATSRADDPHYHIHSLVLNLTQINNGQWYCLHNNGLFKNRQLFNSYFFNSLARQWLELGYAIEPRQGYVTIAGIQSKHKEHFSTRRQQILKLVPANASRQKRQVANLKTRVAKKLLPERELKAQWKNRARKIGLTFPTRAMNSQTIESTAVAAVIEAIAHFEEKQVAISRKQVEQYILNEKLGKFKQKEIDEAISTVLGDLVLLPAGKFMTAEAVSREFETIALAKHDRDRIEQIVPLSTAQSYLKELENDGIKLTVGQANALLLAATSNDRVVIWQGIAGSGKSFALKHFTEIAADVGIVTVGIAPTDSAKDNLARSLGIECMTLAKFLKINGNREPEPTPLALGGKIEVDRALIVDESGLIGASDLRSLLKIATALNDKVILVGAPRSGSLRDRHQHKPVAAGEPFASLQDAGVATAIMDESIRQTNPILKDVVKKLGQKRYGRALAKLKQNNSVIEDESPETILARQYVNLSHEQRDSSLFICSTHRQREVVTNLIREGLKQKGILSDPQTINILVEQRGLSNVQKRKLANFAIDDVVVSYSNVPRLRSWGRIELIKQTPYKVTNKTNNSLTLAHLDGSQITLFEDELDFNKSLYSNFSLEIAVGDRLRWKTSNKSFGITKGEEFYLSGIGEDQVTIRSDRGLATIPKNLLSTTEYAWTHTSHSAQGQTAQQVFLLPGAMSDGISFYTDVARAKDAVTIATADYKKLLASISKVAIEDNPTALTRQRQTIAQSNVDRLLNNTSNDGFDAPLGEPIQDSSSIDEKDLSKATPVETDSSIQRSPIQPQPNLDREDLAENLPSQPVNIEPKSTAIAENIPSKEESLSLNPTHSSEKSLSLNPTQSSEDRELEPALIPDSSSIEPSLFEVLNGQQYIDRLNRKIALVESDEFLSNKKKKVKLETLQEEIEDWLALAQFKLGDCVSNKNGQVGEIEEPQQRDTFIRLMVSWLDENGQKTIPTAEAPKLLQQLPSINSYSQNSEIIEPNLTVVEPKNSIQKSQKPIIKSPSRRSSLSEKPITKLQNASANFAHWENLKQIPLVEIAPLLGGVQDRQDRHKWRFGGKTSATVSITGQLFKDWQSNARGGKNAINFVMHLNQCDFKEAVQWLENNISGPVTLTPQIQQLKRSLPPKDKPLTMPTVVEANWPVVKDYLLNTRQLPLALVDRLHSEKRIYADDRHNAVFVRKEIGKDNNFSGAITGGFRKGTNPNQPFAKAVYGTRSDAGWFAFTTGQGKLKEIVIAEAAIDGISAAAILKPDQKTIFLSSGGVYLPLPIDWLAQQCSQENVAITLAYDRDRPGIEWSWRRIKDLSDRLQVEDLTKISRLLPDNAKDWNDRLRNKPQDPLSQFKEWTSIAQALDRTDKYVERVAMLVADSQIGVEIKERAKSFYLQDYQEYYTNSEALWLAYNATAKNAPELKDILDAAIAFHSPNPTPISPQIKSLLFARQNIEPNLQTADNSTVAETPRQSRSSIAEKSSPAVAPSASIKREQMPTRCSEVEIPVAAAVPLALCLRKGERKQLNSGSSSGEIDTAKKLARELVATANYLTSINQPFENNPRQLLQEYGAKCHRNIDDGTIESIYHDAVKSNPTPTLHKDFINQCIRGWRWNTYFKSLHEHQILQTNSNNLVANYERANGRARGNYHARTDSLGRPDYEGANLSSSVGNSNSPISSDGGENRANPTNPISPRPGVVTDVGSCRTGGNSLNHLGEQTEVVKRWFEQNSECRYRSQRDLKGSGAAVKRGSHQYQQRQRDRTTSGQEPQRNLKGSRHQHKSSDLRIKGRLNQKVSPTDYARNYLIEDLHLSAPIVDRLFDSGLIQIEAALAKARSLRDRLNFQPQQHGCFGFSHGQGDLKRIVLTSDAIEAISAASMSQKHNETTYFVSPTPNGDLNWLKEYANAGVEIMAAYKNDLAGEQLAWRTAAIVGKDFKRVHPDRDSWSNRLKAKVGERNFPCAISLDDWPAIATALNKPLEYLEYVETVLKANSPISENDRTRFNDDLLCFKDNQTLIRKWYEAAASDTPENSAYLQDIARVGEQFNRGQPLKPEQFKQLKADLKSAQKPISPVAKDNSQAFELDSLINKTIEPLSKELNQHLENLAEQASSHIAEVYCQAAAYTYQLEFKRLLKEKLAHRGQSTLNLISDGLQDSVSQFVDRLAEKTLKLEATIARYLKSNPSLIDKNEFFNHWSSNNANNPHFIKEHLALEDIFTTIETQISRSLKVGPIASQIDWNAYVDAMEVASASRSWLLKYSTKYENGTLTYKAGPMDIKLDERNDRLTVKRNGSLLLEVKGLNLVYSTDDPQQLKTLNKLAEFLRTKSAENQKKNLEASQKIAKAKARRW